jgi:hypothetical protein
MTILQVLNLIIDRRIRQNSLYTRSGIVKSVDETKRTCVITIDGVDYSDVFLQGSMTLTKGLVQIPKVGSQVKISFVSQTSAFVSVFGELTKILIDVDLVQFNGGTNDGLVKVNSDVTQLNKIEDDLNALKQAFSTWAVVPQDGGAALKTATATWYGQQLTKTVKNDLQNTKITQ